MQLPIHPYAVYTTKEAAELLKLDPVTIQRYIRSNKLKATLLGKVYRISGQSLLDLMSLDGDLVKMGYDRIKQIESANHVKSKAFLFSDEKRQKYLRLIDAASDALISNWNPDYSNSTEDELTIKYIGSRIFQSSNSAFSNCLNGYYQTSFFIQRDLIEIQFLLDLFKTYPERIKEWREASDKILKEKFSPFAVREILDKRDGFKEKKRAERYQSYCKYASHVTYAGFTLLTNESNQVELGPFYNEVKLLNCIHDVAFNYSWATMSFIAIIKSPDMVAQKLAIEHMMMFHEVFKEEVPVREDLKIKLAQLHKIYSQIIK